MLSKNNQIKCIFILLAFTEGTYLTNSNSFSVFQRVKWHFDPTHSLYEDDTAHVLRSYETVLRSMLGPAILYKINFSNIFCECRKDQRRRVGHASVWWNFPLTPAACPTFFYEELLLKLDELKYFVCYFLMNK